MVAKDVTVPALQVTAIPVDELFMNKESETINDLGIHVTADDTVSISVFISYQWSGEAFNVIPTNYLGMEYVSLNLYQDETDEKKPGEILIVGTQDGTQVTYTPTFDTEKCNMGQARTFTLNQGQTFLILGKTESGMTQNWLSDLTGTSITADKPIGVISGHTKGAFPLYFVGNNPGYELIYANFSRNLLCEMLPPIEQLGTEYISAPIKYIDRTRGLSGVEDDKGDLIRFVATKDGTNIYQMRQDGSSLMQVGPTLNRGQWYNITNQETAAYYKSNYPVLVGHYGKAWWNSPGMMGPKTSKDDAPQNPYRSGQGMMLVLAPVDHWYNYATFNSASAMDDFIYLTIKYSERNDIYFDGMPSANIFGAAIIQIPGTVYAYITAQIPEGFHVIEAKNGALFAGYAYGNWDREKEGFAYGYGLGYGYQGLTGCKDSISLAETNTYGDITGHVTAFDLNPDSTCANIASYFCDSTVLNNYSFIPQADFKPGDKTFSYQFQRIDKTKHATARIQILTETGKYVYRYYDYYPPVLIVEPSFIDFGKVPVTTSDTLAVKVINPGDIPITINNLYVTSEHNHYKLLDTLPSLTFAPGDTVLLRIQGTGFTLNELQYETDTLGVDYGNNNTVPLGVLGMICVPFKVNLYAPPDSSIFINDVINFNWYPFPQSSGYELQVATDRNFNNIILDSTNITGNSASKKFDYGSTYYWHVR
jgi:hypothetical protein